MTASEAREAADWHRKESKSFGDAAKYRGFSAEHSFSVAAANHDRAAVALDAFADGQDAAAREREACAKVADDYAVKHDGDRCSGGDMGRGHDGDAYRGAEDVAALIRARGAK